jgi:hypothetical protein
MKKSPRTGQFEAIFCNQALVSATPPAWLRCDVCVHKESKTLAVFSNSQDFERLLVDVGDLLVQHLSEARQGCFALLGRPLIVNNKTGHQ